jgi:hypothetical protein
VTCFYFGQLVSFSETYEGVIIVMKRSISVVAIIFLIVGPLLGLLPVVQGQEICEAEGFEMDNGCGYCNTSIMLSCDPSDGDCEPCTWEATASISCWPLPIVHGWTGSGTLECGQDIEGRFDQCPPGMGVWGSAECECDLCP